MRSELLPRKRLLLIQLALSLLVLAVFLQTGGHAFVSIDDWDYVSRNPRVAGGLTLEGFSWAFTTFHSCNWHPLTWLSHMADVSLFGMDAGKHHLVNVMFHLWNTLLLFLVLRRMTGKDWESAVVAALFGVHPLHVESVAWVAERKDLLSTLFFLLALGAYLRYVRKPDGSRYLPVAGLFALGLMSKPMLVTFPFVLLLLDFWPLGRVAVGQEAPRESGGIAPVSLRGLLLEKLPLLSMSIASCVMTIVAQDRGGAVSSLEQMALGSRLQNAVVSYGAYLWKMVWPASLSVFYPLPEAMGLRTHGWRIAGSLLLVGGISFLAARQARRRPYLACGWLWYLGTLVPVIGLVQVGAQSMADRYTYVPLIGIFLAATWAAFEFAEGRSVVRTALKAAVPAVVLSLAAASFVQAGHWRDGVALYSHTAAVTERNWLARYHLGLAYADLGKSEEAIASYRESLRIRPEHPDAWYFLGMTYRKLSRFQQAVDAYREAARLAPNNADLWNDLGSAYVDLRRDVEAVVAYREVLRIRPNRADTWYNTGVGFQNLGRFRDSAEAYREAIRIDPGHADAWNNLGVVSVKLGQDKQAAVFFRNALRARPDHPFAGRNLERIDR